MATRRQERVSQRIIQELVEATRDLKNVELGFLTLTRCEVSQNLKHAKVFISVFGKEGEQEKTLALLRNNATRLKTMIARPLGTKTVPSLHFEIDESIANAAMMSRLIKDARATDANQTPMTEEEMAAFTGAQAKPAAHVAEPVEFIDPFEAARMDVEEEILGDEDFGDDPDWKPINLDELPDDDDK